MDNTAVDNSFISKTSLPSSICLQRVVSPLPMAKNDELNAVKTSAALKLVQQTQAPVHRQNSFDEDIKQEWSGVVIAVNNQEFTVQLSDKINPDNPDEIVTLDVEEVDPAEQSLIKPGALLYWHIGYRWSSKRPKERFSKIHFRRLPVWSKKELNEAEQQAEKLEAFFA